MASCLSFVPVRAEPPSQAIETGQPTLSLEDLDALLEEDEVEESVASLNSSEVADIIGIVVVLGFAFFSFCLLYTSPSPRDLSTSRMPSSA